MVRTGAARRTPRPPCSRCSDHGRFHELLWNLTEAAALNLSVALRDDLHTAAAEIEALTYGSPEAILAADVPVRARPVNAPPAAGRCRPDRCRPDRCRPDGANLSGLGPAVGRSSGQCPLDTVAAGLRPGWPGHQGSSFVDLVAVAVYWAASGVRLIWPSVVEPPGCVVTASGGCGRVRARSPRPLGPAASVSPVGACDRSR